jgi:hypothetical protein
VRDESLRIDVDMPNGSVFQSAFIAVGHDESDRETEGAVHFAAVDLPPRAERFLDRADHVGAVAQKLGVHAKYWEYCAVLELRIVAERAGRGEKVNDFLHGRPTISW